MSTPTSTRCAATNAPIPQYRWVPRVLALVFVTLLLISIFVGVLS